MYQLQKNIKFDLMMAYGLIRRYLKKCNTAEHRYNHSIMTSSKVGLERSFEESIQFILVDMEELRENRDMISRPLVSSLANAFLTRAHS